MTPDIRSLGLPISAALALAPTAIRKTIAVLGSAFALAGAAHAQTEGWGLLGHSPDGTISYVQGLRDGPGGKRMWVKYENMPEHPDQTWIALKEYDCASQRSRILQVTIYGDAGLTQPLKSVQGPGEWSYAIPHSISYDEMRAACG